MSDFERDARVLIVEDDEEIAQVLQRSLRMEGYETRIASDGELALDMAADYIPDLVVLDLGLPKLDGMEVARRIRKSGDVPILMLTARDAIESRVDGLDAHIVCAVLGRRRKAIRRDEHATGRLANALQFVDEGLFGDIPEHLRNYLDYDAIARDLACDYASTTIAGNRLAYRCA